MPNCDPVACNDTESGSLPDMPSRARRTRVPAVPTPEHTISYAALVEYLASRAVTELVVVEVVPGAFQVHASLSWRAGRSVLTTAQGEPRSFRSLDRLATLLKTAGIGITLLRLELLA